MPSSLKSPRLNEATPKSVTTFTALEASVNDSAKSMSLLWISFILFCSYLVVATSALTSSALFFGGGLQIPIVAISVGIETFGVVSPLLVCVFGLYVDLQLAGYASKARLYAAGLQSEFGTASERERKRASLDLFPPLQLIAATSGASLYALILLTIIWSSLFLLPLSLLLDLLVKTLPYHSEFVSWSIRASIILTSVGFLCVLLRVLSSLGLTRGLVVSLAAPTGLISLAAWIFACFVAIFPGETVYQSAISQRLIWPAGSGAPLYRVLFEGDFDLGRAARKSPFTNTLVVTPTTEFQESASKLGAAFVRGRDFRQATFIDVNLEKADFSGSMLTGAFFYRVNLKEAHFDCASEFDGRDYSKAPWPDGCTWIHGALFEQSALQGASFNGVRARWSAFVWSSLQGAYFPGALLQASQFVSSDLSGVDFQWARLSVAGFLWCRLSGANFSQAWLLGGTITGSATDNILMIDTHVRTLSLEGGATATAGSALLPIIRDEELFDHTSDQTFAKWKQEIIDDRPSVTPSWYGKILDTANFEKVTLDKAEPIGKDTDRWQHMSGFLDPNVRVEIQLDGYADAAVAVACSSNGSPYVARSMFVYNRSLPDVKKDILDSTPMVVPSLYRAIDRNRSKPGPCPGLKEIIDAWPIKAAFPWINTNVADTKPAVDEIVTQSKDKSPSKPQKPKKGG